MSISQMAYKMGQAYARCKTTEPPKDYDLTAARAMAMAEREPRESSAHAAFRCGGWEPPRPAWC